MTWLSTKFSQRNTRSVSGEAFGGTVTPVTSAPGILLDRVEAELYPTRTQFGNEVDAQVDQERRSWLSNEIV